jgi:peptidoglycan hydrolase CwlO-like protein
MTPQQVIPFIGATISVGGIIFQMGKHADRLDFLWGKVEALETKEEYMNSSLYEIKSDLKTLKHDIDFIKEDIHEIKDCWKK